MPKSKKSKVVDNTDDINYIEDSTKDSIEDRTEDSIEDIDNNKVKGDDPNRIDSFLVHKMIPKGYDDVFFHKGTYERLKIMSKDESIPHIIFHGPNGAGKKTMINIFLRELFNNDLDSYVETHNVSGSGSKIKSIRIVRSSHHISFSPTGTNFDKYIVHSVVKEYAKLNQSILYGESGNRFRVIEICNLDKLSNNAQNSLRRMMEDNSDQCRFIMWAENISDIIKPLISRCVLIRVETPSSDELQEYLKHVYSKFKDTYSDYSDLKTEDFKEIVKYSKRNIKNALWALHFKIFGYDYHCNYDRTIKYIVSHIMNCDMGHIDTYDDVSGIRNRLFHSSITNFSKVDDIKNIFSKIMERNTISDKAKREIVLHTSSTEHDMIRCRRPIIALDRYVIGLMHIIMNDKIERKKIKNEMSEKTTKTTKTTKGKTTKAKTTKAKTKVTKGKTTKGKTTKTTKGETKVTKGKTSKTKVTKGKTTKGKTKTTKGKK